MKSLTTCAFLLCFVLVLPADDHTQSTRAAAVQEAKKPVMFPLVKGGQWEFEVNVNGMTISVSQEMTDVSKKGDTTHATLTTKASGQDITEEISVDEKGIYRHSFNNIKLDKPMLAFKFPIQPQKWSESINVQGMDLDVKMEMKAAEDVTVAAGTYKKVIPVEIALTIQGQEIQATNYYAEGVGIIKQVADLAGTKFTSELKKYTPGAK